MRAAAELQRMAARLQHQHFVSVLVAEERERAERFGFVEAGLEMSALLIGQHELVHSVFYGLDF